VQTAEALREHAYASDIGLAFAAIQKGDLGYAQSLLNKHLPNPGQSDLRGFEWRYLWARSQGDQIASWGRYAGFLSGVVLSRDGQYAMVQRQDPGRLEWIRFPSGTVLKQITAAHSPLALSPSGKLLMAEQERGRLIGLDTQTWEQREPLPLMFPLAFGHRTDREIFVATEDDHLSVWSVTDWQKIGDLANAPGLGSPLQPGFGEVATGHMANSLAVSFDDRFAYLGGAKGIRRWDLAKRSHHGSSFAPVRFSSRLGGLFEVRQPWISVGFRRGGPDDRSLRSRAKIHGRTPAWTQEANLGAGYLGRRRDRYLGRRLPRSGSDLVSCQNERLGIGPRRHRTIRHDGR